MNYEDLLELKFDAIDLVREKFKDIKDKAGEPYIGHLLRVMQNVSLWNDIELEISAVLHDIIEDTELTLYDLKRIGFSDRVIKIIDLVTRKPGLTYKEQILRISEDLDAIKVKMADLEDNSNILRLKVVSKEDLDRLLKYHKSYHILKEKLKDFK